MARALGNDACRNLTEQNRRLDRGAQQQKLERAEVELHHQAQRKCQPRPVHEEPTLNAVRQKQTRRGNHFRTLQQHPRSQPLNFGGNHWTAPWEESRWSTPRAMTQAEIRLRVCKRRFLWIAIAKPYTQGSKFGFKVYTLYHMQHGRIVLSIRGDVCNL